MATQEIDICSAAEESSETSPEREGVMVVDRLTTQQYSALESDQGYTGDVSAASAESNSPEKYLEASSALRSLCGEIQGEYADLQKWQEETEDEPKDPNKEKKMEELGAEDDTEHRAASSEQSQRTDASGEQTHDTAVHVLQDTTEVVELRQEKGEPVNPANEADQTSDKTLSASADSEHWLLWSTASSPVSVTDLGDSDPAADQPKIPTAAQSGFDAGTQESVSKPGMVEANEQATAEQPKQKTPGESKKKHDAESGSFETDHCVREGQGQNEGEADDQTSELVAAPQVETAALGVVEVKIDPEVTCETSVQAEKEPDIDVQTRPDARPKLNTSAKTTPFPRSCALSALEIQDVMDANPEIVGAYNQGLAGAIADLQMADPGPVPEKAVEAKWTLGAVRRQAAKLEDVDSAFESEAEVGGETGATPVPKRLVMSIGKSRNEVEAIAQGQEQDQDTATEVEMESTTAEQEKEPNRPEGLDLLASVAAMEEQLGVEDVEEIVSALRPESLPESHTDAQKPDGLTQGTKAEPNEPTKAEEIPLTNETQESGAGFADNANNNADNDRKLGAGSMAGVARGEPGDSTGGEGSGSSGGSRVREEVKCGGEAVVEVVSEKEKRESPPVANQANIKSEKAPVEREVEADAKVVRKPQPEGVKNTKNASCEETVKTMEDENAFERPNCAASEAEESKSEPDPGASCQSELESLSSESAIESEDLVDNARNLNPEANIFTARETKRDMDVEVSSDKPSVSVCEDHFEPGVQDRPELASGSCEQQRGTPTVEQPDPKTQPASESETEQSPNEMGGSEFDEKPATRSQDKEGEAILMSESTPRATHSGDLDKSGGEPDLEPEVFSAEPDQSDREPIVETQSEMDVEVQPEGKAPSSQARTKEPSLELEVEPNLHTSTSDEAVEQEEDAETGPEAESETQPNENDESFTNEADDALLHVQVQMEPTEEANPDTEATGEPSAEQPVEQHQEPRPT